ncbi:hypothetical protein JCM15765_20070 [Paradesulfitobacterium aromaticivorans]
MSYTGKVLRVNLTTGNSQTENLKTEWADEYIGGKGLGIKYLYEELSPGINPLSPANKLILMTGPFTGTIIPNQRKGNGYYLFPLINSDPRMMNSKTFFP